MKFLEIENFKCFKKTDIALNQLTVFAGSNGSGKSTAIQALLLQRATIETCGTWENGAYSMNIQNGRRVSLNGPYCLALGNSSSVIGLDSHSNHLQLGIRDEKGSFSIGYDTEELKLELEPGSVRNNGSERIPLFYREFYYLNAERIGPRLNHPVSHLDFLQTGYKGEYVAQLLGDTANFLFRVPEMRRSERLSSPRLELQVNAWLDYLMPGVAVTSTYDPETGFAQIKIENKFTRGSRVLATNVGFGISYVLPIIVSGLIAREDRFLVIENPEAHLHPAAQSKIGQFLSAVANSGVNVIIETHSDHVLNGIQIASASNLIPSDNITINFFDESVEDDQPLVFPIGMNRLGELSNWPRGFFDQGQVDYRALLKIRKDE